MAKFHFVLLAILLVAVPYASAKDTYFIGFLGNTNNVNSNALFNSLQLAVDEFNATNTAYTITPQFFSESDPSVSNSIKNQNNLLGVIGNFNAGDRDIIENVHEVPLISAASEFAGLNADKRPNVFRIAASDTELAAATARFLVAVSQKNRFAVVYSGSSTEYMKMAEAFQSSAERNHARADYFKEVDAGRKDFEAVLLRLRDLKVKTIYFAGPASQAALLAKQSSEMNVGADFASTHLICASSFVKASKAGGQGAIFTMISPSSIYGFKGFRPFLKKYYDKYKDDDIHMPYVYDAAGMLLSALPADKKNKNDIVKYLHETKYDGVTGPVYFNDGGERVVSPVYFYIIRGREFLQRDLRGPEFLEYGKMR